VAWLAIWGVVAMAFPSASRVAPLAVLAASSPCSVRSSATPARWRPVSGAVALVLSARLSPGDQAWYVRPGLAERVLVTARHGTRVVIVPLNDEGAEGLSVRRTRVLLVP